MRKMLSKRADKKAFAKGRKMHPANKPKMTRGGYRK